MGDFLELINQYTKSELVILIPVLYVINRVMYVSNVKKTLLPIISCSVSVVLSALYTLSTVSLGNSAHLFLALFTAATQGILYNGISMFAGIIFSHEQLAKLTKGTGTVKAVADVAKLQPSKDSQDEAKLALEKEMSTFLDEQPTKTDESAQ